MTSPVSRRGAAIVSLLAVLSATSAARSQTAFFWNAPTGSSGTWDTSTQNWSTTAAGPVNYTWLNSGAELATFANTTGTVTLGTNISAFGITFSTASYVITDGGSGNTLTLTGAGGVITSNVAATISAPITGTVGLTKLGSGTLALTNANTYSGGTTVTMGGLFGTAQASGSPFGSGAMTLTMASLTLSGIASNTTTTVGGLTIGAASAANTGAVNLVVNNTGGAGITTTFAAGNLVRGGAGSVLVITPSTGTLGTGELLTFTGGNGLTNGILPPWVATTTSAGNQAADFVTYGAGGVAVATYSSTDITTSTNASVVNQSTGASLAASANAYALKTNATINLAGNTLTLGNGSGQSGLILNSGGSISGGTVSFGATEGVVFAQGTTTLGAAGDTIKSNGLTVTTLGAVNLTIGGNIADNTAPARLILTGTTGGTAVTLSGANTYTGGTTLSVNGTVTLNNDAAFSTGKVTNILVPGTSSPQLQSTNGARTFANAFDLNGGINIVGSNPFTFAGPITIINAAAGGTRTLQNSMAGQTVTFGSAGSPSTITIGNPTANGGDNVGKTVVISASSATAVIAVNDVLVDPAPGGGTASGSVAYSGTTGGLVQLNSLNTYTGQTQLNGNTTIQFNHSFNAGDPSGPFGLGTLVPNASANNILVPIGGNRTIANPVQMNTGFTVNNATGDTSSVTFTGPIAMTATGRTLANSMTATGGQLILGSAASPSTLTLATAASQTLVFNTANSGVTVINDVIQNSGSISTAITYSGPGTFVLNAQNTYNGQTQLNGAGTIFPLSISSNALPGVSFTSGPFGVGTLQFNSGTNQHMRPTGNILISNPILMTTGFAMDTMAGDSTSTLTFAGPITMTNNRFISNGFTAGNAGGTLIIGSATAPNVLTMAATTNFTLSLAALNGPIIVNDTMVNASGQTDLLTINPNANDNNYVALNGPNTYSGTTTIGGANANAGGTVLLGSSSVGSPGTITSGPFGTGTVNLNQTVNTPPILVAAGADRTVANAITMTSGFNAANGTAAQDPTGNHSLTLTGLITVPTGTVNRIITNNLAAGTTLNLGSAAFPSTISLSATVTFQSSAAPGGGLTIVNDVVSGTGGLIVQSGTVNLTASNIYTGVTAVTGGTLLANNPSGSATGTNTVSVTGTGSGASAVGTGGTLGGGNTAGTTGVISGAITVSSTTAGSQGGILSPGNNGVGTLTVGAMTWLPFGQYTFEHNGNTGVAGGSANDFLNGSGSLDLSSLAAGNTFTINLAPIVTAAAPAQQTYTLGNFGGGILLPAGQDPTNLNNLFSYTGTFVTAPQAFVSGNLLKVTFIPAVANATTWTGATSGAWNTAGNWNPAAVPASSRDANLIFATTPNATMTNDIPGVFTLNSMTFLSGSPTYSLGGNGLTFQTDNGGSPPQITQSSANGVSLNVPITLTNNLTVNGSGNLTLGGAVGGAGSLTMAGTGTLTLSTANSYAGGTVIQNGTVAAVSDAALGAGNVTATSTTATLNFTGTTATAKSFAMGGGTMSVAAGQTATFAGGTVSSAVLDGPGTFAVNGAQLINVQTTASAQMISTAATDQFRHVVNSGALTVAPGVNQAGTGTTVNLNGFINEGLGSVTIGAQAQTNVGAFQTYGTVTINPATVTETFSQTTLLTNVGAGPLGFNGGSRTFIGTPQTAVFPQTWPDPTLRGLPTFVAGLDLKGKIAVVTSGLFVNNGYVEDSTNNFQGAGTVVADFGSLVKGAGYFQNTVITQNGGKFQAGNSPGAASFGKFVAGPGGVSNYVFAIDDATGTAGPSPDAQGHVSGWGLVKSIGHVNGLSATAGDFTWTATPAEKLTVSIETLLNPTTVGVDVAGPMDHFDPLRSYSWSAVEWAGAYAGPADAAMLDASTAFDTSGFTNPIEGSFGWQLDADGRNLSLTYTPSAVPEPGTFAFTGAALLAVWRARRRPYRASALARHCRTGRVLTTG
jgi:autotransporter-associated beta strand protein